VSTAFGVLRAYLEARAAFTEDDFDLMRPLFHEKHLAAGETLQRAGEVAREAAFVTSGLLRSYVIDAKGKEHIVQFAAETWWLSDTVSMMTKTPSQYFVDAVEDTTVLLLEPAGHAMLLERVRGYAAAFQTGVQKHAAAKDQRIVSSLTASAEDRYLEFMKTYGAIAQRVSQFMLASYLGVSPETLSRIRKHLSQQR
jgi:CRP-like cAMP-binding protein